MGCVPDHHEHAMTNCLPILEREMRTVAKRRRTYYSRTVAALIVSALTLTLLYAGFGGGMTAPSAGTTLFLIISTLGYLYVVLDSTCLTADSLSQEKREGTLGLLFLAGLRGHDVVLAKLMSRSANAACCVLAALPALGLTLFLGGIAGADFVKMVLALFNALFFSASLGLLVSASCRSERTALNIALLGTLVLCVFLPAAGLWLKHVGKMAPVQWICVVPSPAGAFAAALGPSPIGFARSSYWSALFISHLLSWLLLILSSLILSRSWIDFGQVANGNPAYGSILGRVLSLSKSQYRSVRAARRRSWLDINPMIWLGERPRPRRGVLLLFILLALIWMAGWISNPTLWLSLPVYVGTVLLLHGLLMYLAAVEACRGAVKDCRSGVLELLMTTPLGDDILMRGRLLSLKRQMATPLAFVLVADFGCFLGGCWNFPYPAWELAGWTGLFLLLTAKLLVDLYALTWVGVWQGIKVRSAYQAVRRTFSCVVFVRWIFFVSALAALALMTQGQILRSGRVEFFGTTTIGLYFVFYVMTTLHFCGAAMSELKDDFRSLASALDEKEMETMSRISRGTLGMMPRLIASVACATKIRLGSRGRA
jgi:hypothetical protein